MLKLILPILSTFLLSTLLTKLTCIYAKRNAILDIPNERSSHTVPTPRGGGLAIVITFLLSIMWLGWMGVVNANLEKALVGGGLIIAFMGYLDDVFSIRVSWRILVHIVAAIWAVYWIGGLSFHHSGVENLFLNAMSITFVLLAIVWAINFYNFMDGIDGLAGGEGIFIGVSSGIALTWVGAQHLAVVMWLLSASIAGFIVWNWPPAKIFLGDVGSGFLGYIFAIFGLYTVNNQLLPMSFWLIVFSIFLYDATFTLIYRAAKKKQWYSAHREHAYQHLISFGASHKQVTVGVLLINIFILLPIAFSFFYWPEYIVWFLGGSAVLFWSVWYFINTKRIS